MEQLFNQDLFNNLFKNGNTVLTVIDYLDKHVFTSNILYIGTFYTTYFHSSTIFSSYKHLIVESSIE